MEQVTHLVTLLKSRKEARNHAGHGQSGCEPDGPARLVLLPGQSSEWTAILME